MTEIVKKDLDYLEKKALQIRLDLIKMFRFSGKGHIGGSLSIVEIMVALYYKIMNINPNKPNWSNRDRLILSKGHASATWYAVLASKGYFPKNYLFSQFIKIGGVLQEHSDMRKIPGVDMSSGALGQGLSVALGMSLASQLDKNDYWIYAIIGDGEMQSGQIWEALMACSHYKTKNVIAIIDYNKLQVNDYINNVMEIEPIVKKLKAFKWNVLEIDGNNMKEVISALLKAKNNSSVYPTAILSHTIKGKGVSFMENKISWHACHFSEDQYFNAETELRRKKNKYK